jgi:hypothetical protein
MSKILSWADRFALIDHYAPPDASICSAFNLSQAELDTARTLRQQGTFVANPHLDVTKHASMFAASASPSPSPTVAAVKTAPATVHVRPESATKQPKVPQKRGRKGSKITNALHAIPTTPIPVDTFIAQHDVSLAVLRQAKRFIGAMDDADASTIGTVRVRQDAVSKQLMIWREVTA